MITTKMVFQFTQTSTSIHNRRIEHFQQQTFSCQSNFSESQTESTLAANVLYKYVDGKTILSLQPEEYK